MVCVCVSEKGTHDKEALSGEYPVHPTQALKHSSNEAGLKATKILFSFSKIQRSVHRKEKKIEDIHNIPKKQKKTLN